ncbi:MAG: hypothetical protein AAF411_06520 [Myxococcota bacterium]
MTLAACGGEHRNAPTSDPVCQRSLPSGATSEAGALFRFEDVEVHAYSTRPLQLLGIDGNGCVLDGRPFLRRAVQSSAMKPFFLAKIAASVLLDGGEDFHTVTDPRQFGVDTLIESPRSVNGTLIFFAGSRSDFTRYTLHEGDLRLTSVPVSELEAERRAHEGTGEVRCAPVETCGCWSCRRIERLVPQREGGPTHRGGGYLSCSDHCVDGDCVFACSERVSVCTPACPESHPPIRCGEPPSCAVDG